MDNVDIAKRAARIKAYRAGAFSFSTPPVYSGNWDEEAWCNYVRFHDETLTGFIPYNKKAHAMAQIEEMP